STILPISPAQEPKLSWPGQQSSEPAIPAWLYASYGKLRYCGSESANDPVIEWPLVEWWPVLKSLEDFSMSLVLERLRRGFIHMTLIAVALGASGALTSRAFAQRPTTGQSQSGLSNGQRLDVMRSKLEAMRRSLESGVAALNAKDTNDKSKNPDDPATRLR